jgi:hypothetical protein
MLIVDRSFLTAPKDATTVSEKKYSFPVWGTQGGGLVTMSGERYVFVEAPDCPGLDVGDLMPEEWDIVPANTEAREADESDWEF